MKIFIKLSLLCVIVFWNTDVNAQCMTPIPDYNKVMTTEEVNQIISQKSLYEEFTVRVMFHLIRHADGSDGPSVADVEAQMNIMENNFSQADICFALVGVNDILNDDYAETPDWLDLTENTLNPLFGNANRIDIFVFPATYGDIPGNAFSIPSNFCAMTELRFGNSQNLSHELGHCLNLLHTHETFGASCPSTFLEQVDGGNCTTGGDLCCDTPADPNIGGLDTSTCNYTGSDTDCEGATYNPAENNFMSYGWSCRSNFTACQINRMQAELMSGTIGSAYRAPDVVNLSNAGFNLFDHYSVSGSTLTAQNNYTVTGTANMLHTASNSIRLLPGFNAKPSTNGSYLGKINENCN